ncbi:MAG: hypothetical protein KME07_06370 [Pegethrix bostrychoides GSE-TBD4-15B]|uniref:Uncharacterized protein n=1 Tax=Pegethrix bostrychoides GSE-TBD4-15B TaxID=2839662 RepID=A0A951P926_9CYAN|nr:hypothetical protein [Pegethrix bostrychoides GSE-TBD4-15B]
MTYISSSTSTTTLGQLSQICPQLSEGDRLRVLEFALALLEQKSGKRVKRAARFIQPARPALEDWRVGQ